MNGVRVINAWDLQSEIPRSGTIPLTQGALYDIELHYFDHAFTATAKLYWSSPSQQEEIIPFDRLFH